MFSVVLMGVCFQILIHPDTWPCLWIALVSKICQFKALCFSLLTAPQFSTRMFVLVFEWIHRRGISLLYYLDIWLVIVESVPLLLRHCEQLLQLCQDVMTVIYWEKSDLQQGLISWNVDGCHLREGPPSRLSDCQFPGSCGQFPSLPVKVWQLLGHVAPREQFVPRGRTRFRLLQWQLKVHLSPAADNPAVPVSLSWEYLRVHLLVASGGEMGIRRPSPSAPSFYPFCTLMLQ